ncbi:TIGR04222 domain-containing membrane protein [Actinoplanes sp. NPDC048967]|uniref:TIGR04222 domain-containing membrane protein n=1 Tax=Actinoplanes sp. NPDC048967 TaxID=3155269 RepID=UPI0033E69FA4
MNLAAQGDTWGIPGPAFLVLYFTVIISVLILSAIHRRVLFSGNRSAPVDRLGPQQVAYLNGGDQLAVYASLGGLRGAGAITGGPGKTLQQSGPMPAGTTPLDSAVYNAAGRRLRARDLTGDQWVVAAVRQLREGLEAQGLAVTPAKLKAARAWALVGALVVLAGVARLVDGLQNDKPVGYLVVAIVIAFFLTIMLLTRRRRATHAADKGLRALRQQHAYLAPHQSPSYATYGATGAAMGVALYGTATLYTMDPAFAADADVQRINAYNNSGSASGGDSGSSSSCSSGSSSCGGGGGCGGGGCGG